MNRTILAAITLLLAITLQAQKRVNNHMFNPDPAPVVSGDRLYVFTGHDLDTATYFRMPDWQVFSTTDMEHWTDHGIVLTTANFKWAKQGERQVVLVCSCRGHHQAPAWNRRGCS